MQGGAWCDKLFGYMQNKPGNLKEKVNINVKLEI